MFNINYKLRGTIKGQAMMDFVVKLIHVEGEEAPKGPSPLGEDGWVLNMGGSQSRPVGLGLFS